MKTSPVTGPGLVALIAIVLAGCEAAEESAQKIQDKAEQAVQDLAREAISDTVEAFNKQIDQAQQSAEELLGRPKNEAETDNPEKDDEALLGRRVET